MTSNYVKVSLSGDAGDEIFGGYNRYIFINKLWKILSITPLFFKSLGSKAITSIRPDTWNRFFQVNSLVIPNRWQVSNYGEKLHKGARILTSENIISLYRGIVSKWGADENIVLGVKPQGYFVLEFCFL